MESIVTLSELTGKTNFTVEFDALITFDGGITGFIAYNDNDNFTRISTTNSSNTQRIVVNGSATENDTTHSNILNRLTHFKYTIRDNQIICDVKDGNTVIDNRTFNYTVTNDTKFGFPLIWYAPWVYNTFLKNIKIKAL